MTTTTVLDINSLAVAALAMMRDPEDDNAHAHAVQLVRMIAENALASAEVEPE